MNIDIRAKNLTQAINYLKKRYNHKPGTVYRIADSNIYRFSDCVELPAKEIDYKRVEKKFLVFNNIPNE